MKERNEIITRERQWMSTLVTDVELWQTYAAIMSKPTLVKHLDEQLSRLSEWLVPIPETIDIPEINFHKILVPTMEKKHKLTAGYDNNTLFVYNKKDSFRLNLDTKKFTRLSETYNGMLLDNDNRLWCATMTRHIQCLNASFECILDFMIDEPNPRVFVVMNNQLIVDTYNGVYLYSMDGTKLFTFIDSVHNVYTIRVKDELWVWYIVEEEDEEDYEDDRDVFVNAYSLDGRLIRPLTHEHLINTSRCRSHNDEVWLVTNDEGKGIHVFSIHGDYLRTVLDEIDVLNFFITRDGYLIVDIDSIDGTRDTQLFTMDGKLVQNNICKSISDMVNLNDGRMVMIGSNGTLFLTD